jgi:hypothetical protein
MMRAVAGEDQASVEWLRGLRWVERAELRWVIAMPILLAVWVLALLAYAPLPTLALALCSHGMLGLCALSCAPRGRLAPWCGLVLLSQIHFLVFAMLGFTQLELLAWIYTGLAAAVLAACCALLLRDRSRYRKSAGARLREDYRWLLAHAPLPWRLLFARQLARF